MEPLGDRDHGFPARDGGCTPFLAFVEFNIARGEHGSGEQRLIVKQRLASLTDSYSRRRPDGTLIRVRSTAMADGGIVKVFTRVAESRGGDDPAPAPALTAREREVLLWAAQGKTAWETSAILGISSKTVEFHLGNCGRKLGAATKAQTILAAARKDCCFALAMSRQPWSFLCPWGNLMAKV